MTNDELEAIASQYQEAAREVTSNGAHHTVSDALGAIPTLLVEVHRLAKAVRGLAAVATWVVDEMPVPHDPEEDIWGMKKIRTDAEEALADISDSAPAATAPSENLENLTFPGVDPAG